MKKLLLLTASALAIATYARADFVINQANGNFATIKATDVAGVQTINVSCSTCTNATPGGASGTLQFNSGTTFGGISGFTTDGVNSITGGAGTFVTADGFHVQNATGSCQGYGMFLFTGNQLGLCVNSVLVAVWTASAANVLNYNANAERSNQLINVNAGANAIVGQVWRNSTLGAGSDYAWMKLNGGGNAGGTNGANAMNIENTGPLYLRSNGNNSIGIATDGKQSLPHAWTTGLGAITHLQGPTDQPFAFAAQPPAQVASSVAGNALTLAASAATAGSSNNGGAKGGDASLTGGDAARLVSGNVAGGAASVIGGIPAGAAAGGAASLTGGASANIANSTGGAAIVTGGAGTGTNNTTGGGAATVTSGAGANTGSSGGTAGTSGATTLASGAAGVATNNGGGTGGASGAIAISTAAGGAASGNGGTKLGGNSGTITVSTAAGGNAAAGGTPTGGNSGAILLSTGAAGTGSTANGTVGNITLAPGGTNGLVVVGGTSLVRLPSITSDGGLTDTAVCQDTTNHELHSGSGAAGICLGTSSMRYKHDIAALRPGLKEIDALAAVSYRLNKDKGGTDKVLYGFTAEQMAEVLPQLVENDEVGRPNRADYMGVVPVLVKAVQELSAQVKDLQSQLRQQQERR